MAENANKIQLNNNVSSDIAKKLDRKEFVYILDRPWPVSTISNEITLQKAYRNTPLQDHTVNLFIAASLKQGVKVLIRLGKGDFFTPLPSVLTKCLIFLRIGEELDG